MGRANTGNAAWNDLAALGDESLHLGDKKFKDIDVFVRTSFAERVSATAPVAAPFANAPITRIGAGAGK